MGSRGRGGRNNPSERNAFPRGGGFKKRGKNPRLTQGWNRQRAKTFSKKKSLRELRENKAAQCYGGDPVNRTSITIAEGMERISEGERQRLLKGNLSCEDFCRLQASILVSKGKSDDVMEPPLAKWGNPSKEGVNRANQGGGREGYVFVQPKAFGEPTTFGLNSTSCRSMDFIEKKQQEFC